MQVIADLQLHSKYARAVSPQMMVPYIWQWARRKGIGLIATGDWTHPLWIREIKANLEELGNGLLKLKVQSESDKFQNDGEGPLFLLESEVSCIYSQGGRLRRVHTLIWSPTISSAEKINKELTARGANLMSDGRPIIGFTSIEVAEIVLSIDPRSLIIPAHVWTPWFSLYGSESGFDSITECYGEFAKDIFAIETGLSSNPAMNWRIKELDNRSIVSFSDAHSGPKLGREATVFELNELSFDAIKQAIMKPSVISSQSSVESDSVNRSSGQPETENRKLSTDNRIAYTIEFYPEEGKYHYTGHRNCNIKQNPETTRQKGVVCPVCGRKLTVGVMHRVDQLAGRSEEELKIIKKALAGTKLQGIYSEAFPTRPPYVMLVPFLEILAEALGALPGNKNVQSEYFRLTDALSGEFRALLQVSHDDLAKLAGEKVAEAVERVRTGNIHIDPGYDGVFGVVKIWPDDKVKSDAEETPRDQLSLF